MSESTELLIPVDLICERLGQGKNWIQGWGEWDSDGPTCLHGAIRSCHPQPGDAYLIEQIGNKYGFGTRFNDENDWDTINQWLGSSPEITDEMCESTFGPQWREVIAFVRSESTIAPDQVELLNAAWDAAQGAAWGAAWDAAWDAAQGAARGAARGAAWDAARGAAWDAAQGAARGAARDAAWEAAWDAAFALSTRDLIGQHGYTREHYDKLAGPWASVMGPVHPDDEVQS